MVCSANLITSICLALVLVDVADTVSYGGDKSTQSMGGKVGVSGVSWFMQGGMGRPILANNPGLVCLMEKACFAAWLPNLFLR
jgi:hypothetical protein